MHLVHHSTPFLLDNQYRYLKLPNQYIQWVAFNSKNTLRNYVYALWHWLEWCETSNIAWDNAKAEDVLAYRASLGTAAKTINYRMARLAAFYHWMEEHGIVNPLHRLVGKRNLLRVPTQDKDIHLVGLDRVGQFIRAFPAQRDRLIAALMLYCGLRRAEVLTLPRSILYLPRQGSAVEVRIIGKGKKERSVMIPVSLLDQLAKFSTTGTLIFEHNGCGYDPATISHAFRKNAKTTGINIHPHLLRHTFASHRLADLEKEQAGKGGMNAALKKLQSELGHSSLMTTAKYLHLIAANTVPDSYRNFVNNMAKKSGMIL